MTVRPPAVAGRFYPAAPERLRITIADLLAAAPEPSPGPQPLALIVPHAGYPYSGPIAATAYRRLVPYRDAIRHVLLIGPSHCVAFRGLAVPGADAFETPLGITSLAVAERERLLQEGDIIASDRAHRDEHSLEVQLPFLQMTLDTFDILPLVVGDATTSSVAAVVKQFLGKPGWLVVVSSDLSHYHDAATAEHLDHETTRLIEEGADAELSSERACGHVGICGLLQAMRPQPWHVRAVDVRHSGDTAGPRDSVVGYGAYVVA